jgi:isopenicillin N synthase-like dioxygenase
VSIAIPPDGIAFQTGAALETITKGAFKAVPHFVTAPKPEQDRRISRNTLAVFIQPDLDEIVNTDSQETFGQFAKRIVAGNY